MSTIYLFQSIPVDYILFNALHNNFSKFSPEFLESLEIDSSIFCHSTADLNIITGSHDFSDGIIIFKSIRIIENSIEILDICVEIIGITHDYSDLSRIQNFNKSASVSQKF